jgi:AcrR family transcriptional regulator
MSIGNELDRQILDAARSCVSEFGIARTSLSEVARRAGVSRPTVYRRWPDTRTLVAELITREMVDTIAAAMPGGLDGRARLVRAAVDGAAAIRRNPLFDKVFRVDTTLLLTYIVERLGRSQRRLLEVFAAAVADGQHDGSIRAGESRQIATMLLLIAQSAVQSARMVAADLPSAQLDAELARAVDGYLRPQAP